MRGPERVPLPLVKCSLRQWLLALLVLYLVERERLFLFDSSVDVLGSIMAVAVKSRPLFRGQKLGEMGF